MRKSLTVALLAIGLVSSSFAYAEEAPQPMHSDIRKDTHEIRHERRDIRQDLNKRHGERRELQQARRAHNPRKIREERRELRKVNQDIRKDRHEVRHERADRHHDRMAARAHQS